MSGTEALGPRPLHMLSAVETVVEEVRLAIVAGTLEPGSTIHIADLSARLGVSHIPVREALRRLEGDGLVELSRGRRPRVTPLSQADLDDVFHHLQLLEVDAVGRAVPLFIDEQRAAVHRALDALSVGPEDARGSISLRHAQFHQLLVAPACLAWDWHILAVTWLGAARYMFPTLDRALAQGPTALRDAHAELAATVVGGTVAAAKRAAREHLRQDLAQAQAALREPVS